MKILTSKYCELTKESDEIRLKRKLSKYDENSFEKYPKLRKLLRKALKVRNLEFFFTKFLLI